MKIKGATRRSPVITSMLLAVNITTLAMAADAPGSLGQQEPSSNQLKQTPGPAPNSSPLAYTLYLAAREKKEGASLKQLGNARKLLQEGADVNAPGGPEGGIEGRTPLHWLAIGSLTAKPGKGMNAYLELAELLLEKEANVNAEDDAGYTPLDWLANSVSEDLEELLEENGAVNATTNDLETAVAKLFEKLYDAYDRRDMEQLGRVLSPDVRAGTELPIRLTTPVASHLSRPGDRIEAVVIAPIMNGTKVVIPAGTLVEGTVLTAEPAGDRYKRAELALDFVNLHELGGERNRIFLQLINVDNARETVSHGQIIGWAFPLSGTAKLNWGVKALGFMVPSGVSYGVQGVLTAYEKTLDREIHYHAGTEMTVRTVRPEKLSGIPEGKPWLEISADSELEGLVNGQPVRVHAKEGTPSDITNLMFIGPQEEIEAAFLAAGWVDPVKLGTAPAVKTALAALRNAGYEQAPFSTLYLEGKQPELMFQKQNNTFAMRHHVRIYKRPDSYHGRDVWIGAATHDIGIGIERGGTKWIHKIDPRIDAERTKIGNDLLFSGIVHSYALVGRPGAPRKSENATGDRLITDGDMLVLFLKTTAAEAAPGIPSRQ